MIFQEIQRGPELIFGETPRQHEEGTLVALESCALRTERGLHHQVSKCLRAQGAPATPHAWTGRLGEPGNRLCNNDKNNTLHLFPFTISRVGSQTLQELN